MLRYLCLLGADDSHGVQLQAHIPDTLDVTGSTAFHAIPEHEMATRVSREGAELFWKEEHTGQSV